MSGASAATAPISRGSSGGVALSPGEVLLHYRIIAKIGAGGMGEVYSAEDLRLKRKVALKLLPDTVANEPRERHRFEREAKAAAALSHPNVVSIYAVEEAEGRLFITMELLQGKTLAEIVGGQALSLERLLQWAIPLVDAVGAAHQAGIVHRDLKPHNIMIGPDERLRVLDFGLARIDGDGDRAADPSESTATMSMVGRIMGTAAYMSPEQAEGQRADARSDIFSLGVVLYEMATGQRPFHGESIAATLAAILRDSPPLVTAVNPSMPLRLGQIVRRCLEKNPNARYRSAVDLGHALEDLREEVRAEVTSGRMSHPSSVVSAPAAATPTTSAPATSVPTTSAPLPSAPVAPAAPREAGNGRRRTLVPLVALAVVVAAGAVGHRLGVETGLRSRRPIASSLTQLTSDQGPELSPSLSPDGTWFVYASRAAGNWDIHRLRVGGEIPMVLTADCKDDDTDPAISPDGERIAFRSERLGGGIFVMGATGESVRRLTDFGYRPSWTPDGAELLITTTPIVDPQFRINADSRVWVVRVDTGDKRLLVDADALHAVASPHGYRAAYWGSHKGAARDLWTAPLAGGAPVELTDDAALDWAPRWSPDGTLLYFSSNRGGNVNLWRIPVDERSGRALGPPEAVTNGAQGWAYDASFSRDGKRMIYAAGGPRTRLERIRFDPKAEAVQGSPTPVAAGVSAQAVDDRVVFLILSPREDLAVIRPDGTGRRKLTDDAYRDRTPHVSPDGQRVAFTSDRGGGFDIWSIRFDGSGLSQLTSGGTHKGPVWSRDGRRMAAHQDGDGSVLFDPDRPWREQTPEKLPPLPSPGETFCAYDWSPDGQALTGFGLGTNVAGHDVWVYSLEKRAFTRYPTGGAVDEPMWLADGRRILYTSRGDTVSVLDTATGKSHVVFSVAPDKLPTASLSRDGEWIYFSRHSIDSDIWMASLE